ncbi:MAG TPA: LysR family transcriptional regulator [Solirubrobacteraceae bacterium]|nr:LysR family transcriptional regulator [Solirubrobacteraceae bacterium]
MELRHLRYFVAVAEEMHFGHASKRLHIVQPALSKQIAALERELGVTLFSRSKHRISFTPAGEAFYEEAVDILRRVEHATRTAKMTDTGAVGSLDVGFIGPAMFSVLPSLLREHRRRFPGVRFQLHEMGTVPQIRRLQDGAFDAGFVHASGPEEGVSFKTVWREPFVIGLPHEHPLVREDVVDLAACADETFVFIARKGSPGLFDQCLALCQSHGFTPRVIEEGDSPSARYGMVSAGIGVTIAPGSVIKGGWPDVEFRHLTDATTQIETAFAYSTSNHSATLAALTQTLDEVLEHLDLPAGREPETANAVEPAA